MEDIEQKTFTSVLVKPLLWQQYVDHAMSEVSKSKVEILLNQLNSVKPSIQFTVEREMDDCFTILGFGCQKNRPREIEN